MASNQLEAQNNYDDAIEAFDINSTDTKCCVQYYPHIKLLYKMAYIICNTSTSLVSFGCFPRLVMHHSNGRSWAVPLSFDFTAVSNMWNAWRKWWLGKKCY